MNNATWGKTGWITEAKKLNPSYSPQQLSKLYDENIAPKQMESAPQTIASATPQAQVPQEVPAGAPQQMQPQQKQIGTVPSATLVSPIPGPEETIKNVMQSFQTPHQQTKQKWIGEAQRLNPQYNLQTLSKLYDENIVSKENQEPSIQDQLSAIDAMHKSIASRSSPIPPAQDPDAEPSGFDSSDKISAIGALLSSGRIGVQEGIARMKQLGLKGGEMIGAVAPGRAKSFTEEFNRQEARDKLFQEAMHQHPTISAVGKLGGSILPLTAGTMAAAALAPEAAGAAGAAGIGELLEGAAARGTASKFLSPILKRAITGAGFGAMQYDPTGKETMPQMIGGGLTNIALPYGGKLMSKLGETGSSAISELASRYGIHISPYQTLEKALRYIPGSGVTEALRSHGEKIAAVGKEIANKIIAPTGIGDDYGSTLHGEVLNNFNRNKEVVSQLHNKIGELAKKAGGKVNFKNLRKNAEEAFYREVSLPEHLQNKGLISQLNEFAKYNDASYDEANTIKQRIGQMVEKNEKAYRYGSISGAEKQGTKSLYAGIMGDMGDYAEKSGGEIKDIHARASQIFKDKVLPFQRGRYSKFIDRDYDTDKFIGEFLKPDQRVRATRLIDMLPSDSSKGLTAARASILHNALDKADIPGAGFNPEKFVKETLRLKKVNNIIFTKDQVASLEGYQKLVNHIKKISPEAINEKTFGRTGIRDLIHTGVLGSALFHPHIALPLILGATGFSRLITSEAGRKALIKFSQLAEKAGAKQLNPLASKILNIAAASTGAKLGAQLEQGL